MKTTIDLSNILFRDAKKRAAEKDMTFREVVEAGLRLFLGSGAPRPKKFRLKNGSFGGKGLAKGLKEGDWNSIRAMIYEGHGG